MPTLVEGDLTFAFPPHWVAAQYDDWSHYRNQYIKVRDGVKAVDLIAIDPAVCCWLIEVKDYRRHRRTKPMSLADEVADKVIDTLGGLVSAQTRASDADEQSLARQALRTSKLRVVVHLEQPVAPSNFFRRTIDPVVITRHLKRRVRPIDPHPLIVEMAAMANLPWTVH